MSVFTKTNYTEYKDWNYLPHIYKINYLVIFTVVVILFLPVIDNINVVFSS